MCFEKDDHKFYVCMEHVRWVQVCVLSYEALYGTYEMGTGFCFVIWSIVWNMWDGYGFLFCHMKHCMEHVRWVPVFVLCWKNQKVKIANSKKISKISKPKKKVNAQKSTWAKFDDYINLQEDITNASIKVYFIRVLNNEIPTIKEYI